MMAQFKYALRAHVMPRINAIIFVLFANLFFGLLRIFSNQSSYSAGWSTTAIVASSIAIVVILVVCIITDIEDIRSLCSAPAGYLAALTPVPSWKKLFPRLITMAVTDMSCLLLSVLGLFWQIFMTTQSFMPSELSGDVLTGFNGWFAVFALLGYIYLILLVCFCIVLSRSFFYSRKAGGYLAFLATLAVAYLFSVLDTVLVPFGSIDQLGIFYSVNLLIGMNAGTIAYTLLSFSKIAALFLITTQMMERKMNI